MSSEFEARFDQFLSSLCLSEALAYIVETRAPEAYRTIVSALQKLPDNQFSREDWDNFVHHERHIEIPASKLEQMFMFLGGEMVSSSPTEIDDEEKATTIFADYLCRLPRLGLASGDVPLTNDSIRMVRDRLKLELGDKATHAYVAKRLEQILETLADEDDGSTKKLVRSLPKKRVRGSDGETRRFDAGYLNRMMEEKDSVNVSNLKFFVFLRMLAHLTEEVGKRQEGTGISGENHGNVMTTTPGVSLLHQLLELPRYSPDAFPLFGVKISVYLCGNNDPGPSWEDWKSAFEVLLSRILRRVLKIRPTEETTTGPLGRFTGAVPAGDSIECYDVYLYEEDHRNLPTSDFYGKLILLGVEFVRQLRSNWSTHPLNTQMLKAGKASCMVGFVVDVGRIPWNQTELEPEAYPPPSLKTETLQACMQAHSLFVFSQDAYFHARASDLRVLWRDALSVSPATGSGPSRCWYPVRGLVSYMYFDVIPELAASVKRLNSGWSVDSTVAGRVYRH